MKTSDFNFELPENLIAQHPPEERGKSRLLVMDRKNRSLEHRMVSDLPGVLGEGTLMVFNNSRVRKARLYGRSEQTGRKQEFLLLSKTNCNTWQVMVARARRCRPGNRYLFAAGLWGEITGEEGEYRLLRFDRPIDDAWLEIHGHVPLPPYIKREDSKDDTERYQTVYAREYGSAAAPTAGLHFTEELLENLREAGVESAFITLHVGPGTFLPVRSENLEDHKMHEESYNIDDDTACRVGKARAEGRKILAVGTTSLRAMESAWEEGMPACKATGQLKRGEGSTSIFIYPGYEFKAVDALFTNFHTPGSTLLMLVAAFADRGFILDAYREAVREGYKFFSYGDACLIL